ncbi:MAG TPA: thymidine phosphorylase [bacterium]|nr:thymidine phosphorylase [bacterium]
MAGASYWFRDLITRKRDGDVIADDDWRRFVAALVARELPDYQVSALLMAVYFRGMTTEETAALTAAMAASGEQLVLGEGPYVDKHSTGGVGDTVTLVAVPWAAACGARIAKLSGRGLGHTGGTVDKLEAIPGINLSLGAEELKEQADRVGCAVAEAQAIAPADKIIYALRDATATVEALPLIVSSILSKKLAGGAPAFVFDVKAGRGAFAKDEDYARKLGRSLVAAARASRRRAVAVITAMDQPLGYAVGSALEVAEAVATLRGQGPDDLLEVSAAVAAEMLVVAGVAGPEEARRRLDATLESGEAFAKLDEMARAQGAVEEWWTRLPEATKTTPIKAERGGYVSRLDAFTVARAANALGAGRQAKEDVVDPAAGVVLHKKEGEPVAAGDELMTLHYDDDERLSRALDYARVAFDVGEKPVPRPLILGVLR